MPFSFYHCCALLLQDLCAALVDVETEQEVNLLPLHLYIAGSVMWITTPELFIQGPRDIATSMATIVFWISCIIVSESFEFMVVCKSNLITSNLIFIIDNRF